MTMMQFTRKRRRKSLFSYLRTDILASVLFISALPFSSQAHDFWLSPDAYSTPANSALNISVMVGHPVDKMAWPVDPHRIISFRSLGATGLTDHQGALSAAKTSKALPIRLSDTGLHILSIETTHAFSELESEKFNDYVEEEGLLPIKIDRLLKKSAHKPGKEIYSRRGKTIIQVGPLPKSDPVYLSKPLGLTLEIVPMENPARIEAGGRIRSQIFYRGAPLKGAQVGLIDLDGERGRIDSQKSDANGFVEFKRPERGSWMQHVVWSDPLEDKTQADYDTIFSSLSFSVD
ncbi:putative GH25 family protein [Litorimonas taeanensis]|uniref:Putative GH25 family protein n=1 Tax=Litorimonas taeanensis TaxID=568099 RepID=A0A420WF80_9PROT|nr:DUF4198 domain-containing protein [Litorimonas taeanensis]RKQ69648.1 putative GH25 family protein [Litorimonas taeanensis]